MQKLYLSLPGRTRSYLDSLKTSYELENNDSLKVAYAIHLTWEIYNNSHNEEEEYRYARDAINRALSLNDTLLYARALDNLGLLYRYHQHYGEALSLHTKAFKLIKDKKVKPLYKMIFANNAGVAARYNQEYDLSIAYYMKALKIAEQENDLRNIAISTNGIGNALGNIPGRKEAALNYFKRSLNAETKRENSLGIAMNYLSIRDYYMDREQFAKARSYLHKLLEINQNRKDRCGLAITYEFYGKCYFKEGKDLEKALYFL